MSVIIKNFIYFPVTHMYNFISVFEMVDEISRELNQEAHRP